MFAPSDWLLLDIGNTRVHWRLGEHRGDVEHAALLTGSPAGRPWSELTVSRTLCVSVGAPETKALLAKAAGPNWHEFTAPEPGLLASRYAPLQLGRDRWLAMLGARNLLADQQDGPNTEARHQRLLVVNAGTAVTVDMLDEVEHLGGWIMPGYRLWHNALHSGTQIRHTPALHGSAEPGENTAAAIANAWTVAVNGQINSGFAAIPTATLVVTGGDADRLLAQWPAARVYQDLVLAGLLAWGHWLHKQEL